MKNLELKNFELIELSNEEMVSIEGGSWFSRAINNIGEALNGARNWLLRNLNIAVGSSSDGY